MHVIKLEKFEGPLQLLYQLIEGGRMEITEVALGRVTGDFLTYLDQTDNLSVEELTDFLVVAAKLLLLKSKALLPELKLEAEEGPSLEDQLRMYREFVLAAKQLAQRLKANNFVYFRPAQIQEPGFYPPEKIKAREFPVIFREVVARLEPIFKLPQTSLAKNLSIKEKIKHIYQLLQEKSHFTFSHFLSLASSKTEIIVSFLALLELVKQKDVLVEQGELFEEIVVRRNA